MNLIELSLKLNGFPIAKAKRKLESLKNIPEDEYYEYVVGQRNKIVENHLKNNPYYRYFTGIDTFNSWEELPVMQKKDLQYPLKHRLSKGFTKKNIYINKTSGSSGHPFIFAKDKWCHALTWAEIFDRFNWYGLDFHHSYQARFYGIPLDFWGYQKERLKDSLSNRFRFPIFDLSDSKLEEYLKKFKTKKFDYINGYTSAIVLFAKYLNKLNIRLIDICPTLKYCIVTSEMLYESDRVLMESVFGVPVVNEYGASELDLIAFTNPKGSFIVNSETLFVEILDEQNNPVPNGKEGRIIITSLYNRAHPMIRYDIGDTGVLSTKSTYKTPILETLLGRTNDVANLPSGKTVPGLTFYYVTKSFIEDDGNVKEFIIEQHRLNLFKIIYTSEKEISENKLEIIRKSIDKYLEEGINLTFKRVDLIKRNHRGKLKQFISYL